MKFIELLKKNDWKQVKPNLIKWYPEENKPEQLLAYELVYIILLHLPITPSENLIELKRVCNPNDEYIHVYMLKSNDKQTWDIGFLPRSEVLGMNLSTTTLKTFTELEIISHCLYEMTFYSFVESETQRLFEMIKEATDQLLEKKNTHKS